MRTLLIPGLGADPGLFAPQASALGDDLVVVAPSMQSIGGSVQQAARQMADRLDAEGLLDEHYALEGMSVGGSMALEVARVVPRRPQRLMLIASNRTSDTIPLRFGVGRWLGALAPWSVAPQVLSRLARFFAWRDGLDAAGAAWLSEIATRTDVPMLLWGAKAIAGWRFTDADAASLGIPLHQLHDERDWVLPLVRRHTTLRVPGARHLVNWSHAPTVNRWLTLPGEAPTTAPA